jgi:amino acid adenylation domain-containing protein
LGTVQPIAPLDPDPASGTASALVDPPAPANALEDGADDVFAFPLSFAQQRLWFLDQMQSGTALYNIPVHYRLHGSLDVDALRRTLTEIVRRHESLRTVFRIMDEQPRQVVLPARPVPLPLQDLSALPRDERDRAADQAVAEESARAFDLQAGPLIRASLVRLAPEEHLLSVVMHHIISDGWSMGVLTRELAALYDAFSRGLPSPLDELAVQYADVAMWQRENLEGEALDRQVAYWREHLAGAPAVLELPTDRPRPPVQTFPGAGHVLLLPVELMDRLRALGRREDVTPFMTLLAALNVLLGRWCGQRDVVVGSPIAGRTYSELEELIGFFVNTLVLRARMDDDPPFRTLLGRVREATLGAYGNQDVPFERLVEELHPERDMSRPPLFQVMFMLQNMGREEARDGGEGGLAIQTLAGTVDLAKFDLTFAAVEQGGALSCHINYNTDLFDAATIVRLGEGFRTVLEGIAADPDARVSRLPVVPADEREQLLVRWNAQPSQTDGREGMHGAFEAQAARTPDAVALVFDGRPTTYAELDAHANRVAHHLRALGVGPDTLVGLCTERTPRTIAALLGILKAGGAYVPLDPAYPADRLAYMLADSGATVLVSETALLPGLRTDGVRVVDLDRDDALIAARPSTSPGVPVDTERLAYIIYTSGSTGRPKGAMVRHGGVANFLRAMVTAPGFTADDVVLAVTTLSFDISVLELLLPLSIGARAVLAGREVAGDPALLSALIASSGATALQATPTSWRMLLDAGWTPPPVLMMTGGEPLPRDLGERLMANGARLWNLYGPTETTVWSSVLQVEPGGTGPVRIGGPIPAATNYVLSPEGEPVPLGVFGELYIGGAGVGRGYMGRPGLTAATYLPDPFSRAPGARMYRTGDRVRWRPDATLEISGRLDTQVKLRGFRIELGEIESALREHEGVLEACCSVREDVPGDPRLVAYVLPAGEAAPAVAELRARLHVRLPEYMVPGAFVVMDEFPLTPSGKIDRRALPAPGAAATAADAYEAPATPTEEAVAQIWSDILRVERVGAGDNFFALGGHSLLATQVVARIRTVLDAALPVRTLFEARTVRELAARVDEEKARGAAGARGIGSVSRDRYRIPVARP